MCRRGDGGCRGSPSAMGHRAERAARQTAQSESLRDIIMPRRKRRERLASVCVIVLTQHADKNDINPSVNERVSEATLSVRNVC